MTAKKDLKEQFLHELLRLKIAFGRVFFGADFGLLLRKILRIFG